MDIEKSLNIIITITNLNKLFYIKKKRRRIRWPEFKCYLYHLVAVWPWKVT